MVSKSGEQPTVIDPVRQQVTDTSLDVAVAIERSIKNNPQQMVDAIYPVMGPAIRKAISGALTSMAQSLNQRLTYNFSLQGLKWRLESLRTGRSFAEVVLLHTLVYRVEQVFLIHRETGLLLQHCAADHATTQDPDMVSGMLTAIQDFVHNSFRANHGDLLETFQVGELAVWVEQSPQAFLAGVVRGNAPATTRDYLRATLESIHLEFYGALADFAGDAMSFAATRPLLQGCLQTEYQPQSANITPLMVVTGVVLAALLVGFVFALRNI